jgi:hypothetical protein
MEVKVNLLAVLLCTVASMIIGMIWYMPKVFGGAWMKMAKVKMGDGSMGWTMGTAILSSFVMAYVLAHVTYISHSFFRNSYTHDAVTTAFWMWIGFMAIRQIMRGEFNLRRKKETLIHISNDFVTIMAMALIIGWLGVK